MHDIGEGNNYPTTLTGINAAAAAGDAKTQNLLGILYAQGVAVAKNEDIAYSWIKQAAEHELPEAQYNLGRLYMIGAGCDIDFDQAKYWLEKAANNGNQRAAYAIGYMYFKGLGLPQSYKKAISWFELSPWPMAKHFLGTCYYFGYGTPPNDNKAITYYAQSKTPNSDMMLYHIMNNVRDKVSQTLAQQTSTPETQTNTAIAPETLAQVQQTNTSATAPTLKPSYLNGKWQGKLLEMDYAIQTITRIVPVIFEFKEDSGSIHYTTTINGVRSENTGIWEGNSLYFNGVNMTFEQPYSENPASNTIDWQLLAAHLQFKTINGKTYLTAGLDTFCKDMREQGPPMRLVLKPYTDGKDDYSVEELMALADQKDQFIVLYPNPVVDNVLIEYELEQESPVTVNVYDMTGNPIPNNPNISATQGTGKHKYTLAAATLPLGMYIVRVGVADTMHSRILIKN